jgi:hypothetical protein
MWQFENLKIEERKNERFDAYLPTHYLRLTPYASRLMPGHCRLLYALCALHFAKEKCPM